MLQLDLPFRLTVKTPGAFLHRGFAEAGNQEPAQVILEGLGIVIRTGTKIFQVTSERPLEVEAGPSRATTWRRWFWQLEGGIAIEQQLAVPDGGDALAISWRSVGRLLLSCRFEVSPIFSASQPFAHTGFQFEPETNGGRLTWQPLPNTSKIIADTNGRFDSIGSPSPTGIVPAAFEFDLSPQPAVLIFSSESPRKAAGDPLIGGFLARLSADPGATTEPCHFGKLAAA